MALYEAIIGFLSKIGFFDIILPWILTYGIVYGILSHSKIFGDPYEVKNDKLTPSARAARQIYSIISFAIATLVIGSVSFVRAIKEFIPMFVLFLIIVFTLIVIIASFAVGAGKEVKEYFGKYLKYIGIIASLLFVYLVLSFFGLVSSNVGGGKSFLEEYKDVVGGIIVLVAFLAIAYWITKPGGEKAEQKQSQQ